MSKEEIAATLDSVISLLKEMDLIPYAIVVKDYNNELVISLNGQMCVKCIAEDLKQISDKLNVKFPKHVNNHKKHLLN